MESIRYGHFGLLSKSGVDNFVAAEILKDPLPDVPIVAIVDGEVLLFLFKSSSPDGKRISRSPPGKDHTLMRLSSVRIQNLRSCCDVEVPFNDYTCLVGANGAGKSNILCALNLFFRQAENTSVDPSQLVAEDFHNKNTAKPVTITVTLTDLEPEAQQDFADYVRQGKLVISSVATFDPNTQRAEVKQFGERLGIPAFKEFFKGLGDNLKAGDLKLIYEKLQADYPDLPKAGGKDANAAALNKYESSHPELCDLLQSEDQFYGFSKGANRLAKYIQWVYVPAVKDATSEQTEARNTALGRLLARTVRLKTKFSERLKEIRGRAQQDYEAVLQQNQSALDDISKSLKTRLMEWAHPDASLRLEWRNDPDKSVQVQDPFAQIIAGEGDFEGELARFGHGLQRSYLLALLQELATTTDGSEPRLILACEEPELYQHPPQARHLAGVLRQLGSANSQVIVCTHSPYFVSGDGFEDVRMVRKDPSGKCTTVASLSYADLLKAWIEVTGEQPKKPEGVLAKVHQELQPQLNEMFFTNRLILVEGLEDVAFITTQLHLLGKWEEYRRSGSHLVPVGGKNHLIPALLIAQRLNIPTFIVFDSDAHKAHTPDRYKMHEKDNTALLKLSGVTTPNPMPTVDFWGERVVMWHSEIGEVVKQEIGKAQWEQFSQAADNEYGSPGGLDKNTLHIAATLSFASAGGAKSTSLERLCTEILAFGKTPPPPQQEEAVPTGELAVPV